MLDTVTSLNGDGGRRTHPLDGAAIDEKAIIYSSQKILTPIRKYQSPLPVPHSLVKHGAQPGMATQNRSADGIEPDESRRAAWVLHNHDVRVLRHSLGSPCLTPSACMARPLSAPLTPLSSHCADLLCIFAL